MVGQEAPEGRVVAQPSAGLREQVRGRTPAPGHQDQIARQRACWPGDGAVPVDPGHSGGAHPAAPVRVHDGVARHDLQPGFLGAPDCRSVRAAAVIHDGGDGHAVGMKLQRRLVGAVVVGHHHSPPAGEDGEAVDVRTGGSRKHHPRSIVVGEHQWSLQRARRQHHTAGADAPQALARKVGRRVGSEMIRNLLKRDQEIVIEVPCDRGSRQHPHVLHRVEFGRDPAAPAGLGSRLVGGHVQERAARLAAFVGQNDPRAVAAGGLRSGHSRGPGADDQHVAVRVHPFVPVRVLSGGRTAHTRHPPDRSLVEMPAAMRPHERLVVEACRNQPVGDIDDGSGIEPDAGPAVHAGRSQSLVKLDPGGLQVGHAPIPGLELHQRIRLLGARGQNSPRPVVLEAATDQVHAVCEQGRCKGVSRKSRQQFAVEREADRSRPVDCPTIRQTERLAGHDPSTSPSSGGVSPIR